MTVSVERFPLVASCRDWSCDVKPFGLGGTQLAQRRVSECGVVERLDSSACRCATISYAASSLLKTGTASRSPTSQSTRPELPFAAIVAASVFRGVSNPSSTRTGSWGLGPGRRGDGIVLRAPAGDATDLAVANPHPEGATLSVCGDSHGGRARLVAHLPVTRVTASASTNTTGSTQRLNPRFAHWVIAHTVPRCTRYCFASAFTLMP